jgi:hypothetical protein
MMADYMLALDTEAINRLTRWPLRRGGSKRPPGSKRGSRAEPLSSTSAVGPARFSESSQSSSGGRSRDWPGPLRSCGRGLLSQSISALAQTSCSRSSAPSFSLVVMLS